MKTLDKKSIIFGISSFVFLLLAIFLFFNNPYKKNTKKISVGQNTFFVEVAKTSQEKYLGLSGKKNLCSNCGMIFEFEKPDFYDFTMRGMNFPLDFVWINGDKVVDISKNIQRDVKNIRPQEKADRVLEIPAGTCDKENIRIGDGVK